MGDLLQQVEKEQLRGDIPDFSPGDTVRVLYRVREGDKERIQAFEGICVGRRGESGPFSERQRRLVLGIAQSAATALENARLIADLRTANRLKTEFVSTMSHELRTPLHVILGFAEMAYDLELTPPQRREYLARIQQAGRDLLDMIESTLEIGRLEAGRDEVRSDEIATERLFSSTSVSSQTVRRSSSFETGTPRRAISASRTSTARGGTATLCPCRISTRFNGNTGTSRWPLTGSGSTILAGPLLLTQSTPNVV